MFQVYKSSAGSGKTTTLVRDYLRICLPEPRRFATIAGITFTKKATLEMKTRIMETLRRIAANYPLDEPYISLFEELISEHKLTEEQLRLNADELLRLILHQYDNFAFTTIDSFVLRIVKTFAFDLRLPLNFDVQLDVEAIQSQSVARLLDSAGMDEKLTKHLVDFLQQGLDDDKEISLQQSLEKFSKILFNDAFYELIKTLRHHSNTAQVAERITKEYIQTKNRIYALAAEACELIDSHGIDYSHFMQGKNGVGMFFKRLGKDKQPIKAPTKNVMKMLDLAPDKSWAKNNIPADEREAIDSIRSTLEEILRPLTSLISDHLTYKAIYQLMPMVRLIERLYIEIANYYEEAGAISLSEASMAVARVVETEPMPFIYERIGTRFNHYLIDEFQDTSTLQWRNLVPLIENSLSEGFFNLVVGDAKQSIYRWRGGDYEQFVQLPNLPFADTSGLTAQRQALFVANFNENRLDTNYRSCSAIVNFNNGLYTSLKDRIGGLSQEVYKEVEQKVFHRDEGFVGIYDLTENNDDDYYATLCRVVEDLHARGYNYGDLAVLARTNKHLGDAAQYLIAQGVEVVSADSLRLDSSVAVMLIIHFLRLLNEHSVIARQALLTGLKDLDIIVHEQMQSLSEAEALSIARETFSSATPFTTLPFDSGDTVSMIDYLVHGWGLYSQAFAYLSRLSDMAAAVQSSEGFGIAALLDYWDTGGYKETVDMPDSKNAVNLYTIHKSKGLQFPVVIYLHKARKKNNSDKYLVSKGLKLGNLNTGPLLLKRNDTLKDTRFSEELMREKEREAVDEMNTNYVATTRAGKELHILSSFKKENIFLDYAQLHFTENQDEEGLFVSGKPFQWARRDDQSQAQSDQEVFYTGFIPWEDRFSLRTHKGIDESRREHIDRGLRMHALLSQLHYADELSAVMDLAVARGLIHYSEKEQVYTMLKTLISSEALGPYFTREWEVLNEQTVMTAQGESLRPDRVLLREDKVVVLDYKWSDYAATPEPVKRKYHQQLKAYITAMQDIYPKAEVRGLLAWMDGNAVAQTVQL